MRATRLILVALVVVGAGCFIGAGSFAGKGCESNNDCPEPYVCAQLRGATRSCELLHRIELGGTAGGPGQTVNPDYCTDVKPIIDKSCVANCHGIDNSATGLLIRMDKYNDPAGGCFEKADRIKARTQNPGPGSMPPQAHPIQPTLAERALVVRWVNTGATYCNDGGRPDGG